MAGVVTAVRTRDWRPRARKYLGVAAIAVRQGLGDRAALAGRMGFYAIILLIFSKLWAVVAERGGVPGTSAGDLVWYLAVTEWVVLSLPPTYLAIEADVRRGDIAYRLPRPISYLGARLAESVGDFGLRAATLGVAGFALAFALTGGLPDDPRGLLLALPLGLAAGWVGLCAHAAIGIAAVWLQDCSPVYWIWQKCAFILGGLMLPLEIYPAWLREIALWTPFAAMMHGPARMVFGWQPEVALAVGGKLVLWSAVLTGGLLWVHARALRDLDVNGG